MLRRKTVLIIILMVIVASLLTACDLGKSQTELGTKTVSIIIGTEQFSYSTNAEYVHQMLKEMSEQSLITYEYSDGAYGATIIKLNDLITDVDWDPFISIYHNIDDVTLRSDYGEYAMDKYEYNGVFYYPSSVGADSLPVLNEATYIFVEMS